ncbi:erythromycin esterase family protein [Amniculibacterium sp. G2-70]|uniref:erythromycin esterase family protein n=1 Tax=Amniculibacterium sp. G2-70 TaxID=2767188 RepID=UPI001654685F|nr:erythromycin esterase family protein [Amniculibacterium sp. G2-70]MBS1548299.1 erythromycin esterase family protein [Bacteroidota bacterium]
MKKISYAFIIFIFAALVLNKMVYQEIPWEEKQDLFSEVQRYKHPIKSISMEYLDDNDLKVFDTILKDNRVLMLGENTHSDGATFKLKSRLIKYLHENLNYNVVLYEAAQYDTWIMNEEMNHHKIGIHSDSIGGLGLFEFWWANREMKPLIEYYQKTKISENPIELGGFDFQFSGVTLSGRRAKLLKDFLEKNNININNFPIFSKNIKELEYFVFESYANKILKENYKNELLLEINKIEKIILKLEKTPENIIYALYFNDLKNNFQKSWNYKEGSMSSMHYRDSIMAKNLIYQIDDIYKNKKIIIWCANIHTFTARYDKDYLPLGAYIKDKYGKASYMLNFSTYAKKSNKGNLTDKPGKHAIENIFHETKTPYFFINLRDITESSPLKKEFVSTINQGVDQRMFWSRFLDGIFFIDTNTQLTPNKK